MKQVPEPDQALAASLQISDTNQKLPSPNTQPGQISYASAETSYKSQQRLFRPEESTKSGAWSSDFPPELAPGVGVKVARTSKNENLENNLGRVHRINQKSRTPYEVALETGGYTMVKASDLTLSPPPQFNQEDYRKEGRHAAVKESDKPETHDPNVVRYPTIPLYKVGDRV